MVLRALDLTDVLWLYSLDARTYEHDAKIPLDTRTLDECWVDSTPEELADWFEDHARSRFPFVLDDLTSLDDGAPVLAEGPHLLPELVSGTTLFVIAAPELQRRLVIDRGSDLYARTRDPQRALANRLARDEILAARLRESADVVEISDVEETTTLVERFELEIASWVERDHGDAAARRRHENEARLRQLSAHAAATGTSLDREIELACECGSPGCTDVVRVPARRRSPSE